MNVTQRNQDAQRAKGAHPNELFALFADAANVRCEYWKEYRKNTKKQLIMLRASLVMQVLSIAPEVGKQDERKP